MTNIRINSKEGRQTLAACLVVYHEEKLIRRCLESVKDCVDTIYVFHDGPCEDKTLEIAKEYDAQIEVLTRIGSSCIHKPYAIETAREDWVLIIDADEYLSEDLMKNVRGLIQEDGIDGYSFVWPIWDGNKYLSEGFPNKAVLFRKSKAWMIGYPDSMIQSYGRVVETRFLLEHKPTYNNFTRKTFMKKWRRFIEARAIVMVENKFTYYNVTEYLQIAHNRTVGIQVRYAHPLSAPLYFVAALFKSLFIGGYFRNPGTWRVPLFQGLYGFALCIMLWKIKKMAIE